MPELVLVLVPELVLVLVLLLLLLLLLCPRCWCCAYGPGTVSTTVPDATGAPVMWSATACHATRN